MGDKIVLLSEKVQSLSYNSHTAFSPSAQFWHKSGKNDVFSDPCYGGSNVIFDQNRNIPQVLYIKLHLKMPGNINISMFLIIWGRLVPPLAGWLSLKALRKQDDFC